MYADSNLFTRLDPIELITIVFNLHCLLLSYVTASVSSAVHRSLSNQFTAHYTDRFMSSLFFLFLQPWSLFNHFCWMTLILHMLQIPSQPVLVIEIVGVCINWLLSRVFELFIILSVVFVILYDSSVPRPNFKHDRTFILLGCVFAAMVMVSNVDSQPSSSLIWTMSQLRYTTIGLMSTDRLLGRALHAHSAYLHTVSSFVQHQNHFHFYLRARLYCPLLFHCYRVMIDL